MTDQRTPQGGLPRPKKKHALTLSSALQEQITPRYDLHGRYLLRQMGYGRSSIQLQQVGSAHVCVLDDFGFLQVVYSIAPDWRAL
jgi:hypothetical protein